MKAGKEYEILIENLYRELEPNAIITQDDYIYDKNAQIKRQIDVSIKYKFAGVNHLIIIQAKDYKHKANITVVDQFQKVIEDVNANKGILICANGFTKSALTKAKNYGIECLTVHSATNKKWETLLKIPVKVTTHEFTLDNSILLNIAHKAGREVKLLDDTFSYDCKNLLSITDIINEQIFKKMGWHYIIKSKKIRLDLKKLKLFHSFDNEMLPIEDGFVEIKYLKTKIKTFYIDPSNYIYTTDHLKENGELHNLTITKETINRILEDDFINDKSILDKPVINFTKYLFNENIYLSNFEFKVKGGIEGDFFIKDNKILDINDRTKAFVELEQLLKNQHIV